MKKVLFSVITAFLLIATVSSLIFWKGSSSLQTEFSAGKTVLLDFTSIKCVKPVSVSNARWQLAILVTNRGTRSLLISKLYVNQKEVDVYGLVFGDTLKNGHKIGTSVSMEGLSIDPGESMNLYVWIGDKLFSSGSRVVIHFNDPNSVTLMKSTTLS